MEVEFLVHARKESQGKGNPLKGIKLISTEDVARVVEHVEVIPEATKARSKGGRKR